MKSTIFFTVCFFLFFTNSVFSQTTEQLKKEAIEKAEQEDFSQAIKLLEEALKNDPTDKEVYYYLGQFNHFRAYDSRSFNYDRSYCDKIYYYLDKALELDSNYGDALFFYEAQCVGDAIYALQNNDTITALTYYSKAYEKKCLAPWLIEFGMNILNSCEDNAILFCNCDAEFITLMYLQQIKNVRQDVTVILRGFLDRVWYVLLLKNGLGNFVKKQILIYLNNKYWIYIYSNGKKTK